MSEWSAGWTMESLADLREAVALIRAQCDSPPNMLPMAPWAFRVLDKARVRWGLMPLSEAGRRYARRRQRMARKRRRGWS